MYNINFVRQRQRTLSKQQQQDLLALRYAGIGTAIVGVITASVLGLRFFLQFRLDELKTQETTLKRSVLSQEEVERSYVVFANKLKVIRQLLDDRSDKKAAIAFFTNVFGSTVLIREINFGADDGVVEFGLKSENVFSLDSVFSTLKSEPVKAQFAQISKSELRRSADGSYDMNITVVLKKDDAKEQK